MITSTNLTKHYGDVKAVNSLNLKVNEGEIYGFLGLNGAGKTTTIRMLLGMINPSEGQVSINNQLVSPNNTALWRDIGYLVETPYSYGNLTLRENLDLIRRLRQIKDRSVIDRIIKLLDLEAYANRKAKNLSLGNKQRLGLAKAMMHQPRLLILDEPTNGLDPFGIHEVREMLLNLSKKEGVTIFISSHILSEIARFASRIGIIHKGMLVQETTKKQLDDMANKHLVVQCAQMNKAYEELIKKGLENVLMQNDKIEIADEEALKKPHEIAELLVNANCDLSMLKVEEEDLESYFLRTIKQKNQEILKA